MEAPKAKQIPHVFNEHGNTRVDNYYWLNERENPEVIDYLNAENEYLDSQLKHTEPLQKQLYDEIIARIKQDDMSLPVFKKGYYYYSRYEEGKEYGLSCRKKGSLEAEEEILLDCNALAEGYAFFSLGGSSVSPDTKLLAYSVDTVSRRQYRIFVKEIATGKHFEEEIPNTTGGITWANDNKTFFYTLKDAETLRSYKIMRHTLGTPVDDDVEVYCETDNTFNAFVGKTKSERYIFIGSESTLSTEYRFVDADHPYDEFKIVEPRQHDMLYYVDHYGDDFYIVTNADGAKNFKIMKTPVAQCGKQHWTELMAHRSDVLIEGVEIFSKYLVVEERFQGLMRLRVMTWDGSTDYYLDFGEPTYTASVGVNLDFDAHVLRYSYTSMTTPSSVFEFNMDTKEKTLLKQQEVVGGYNSDEYKTERLMVPSHDGVLVPVSLVYRKDKFKPSTNPLVLYGYGSYGMSMEAYFSTARLSLLNRGFVWAVPHIRGGSEMGRQWYDDGKMLNKKNTFLDFIACGNYLVENGYAAEDKLFAMGGSAGGLLVGAVANMAPQMWRGIIADVPFVDVVTTMLDESIPLTTGEYDEWGNPNEEEYYKYMLSYSPYDNVEAKEYPAMLVTTGLHDSQVQYWEPAKWVSKLRELKTNNSHLFLRTNMDFGHGGASGRFEGIKEIALEYAFMLNELGEI